MQLRDSRNTLQDSGVGVCAASTTTQKLGNQQTPQSDPFYKRPQTIQLSESSRRTPNNNIPPHLLKMG